MEFDRDDASASGSAGHEEEQVDIDAIPSGPSDQPECRICSGPAEENAPLFYPCKCSGSIKYIHQECLKTWLAQSKKRSCDICKHPYAFQKVYKPDMPKIIPPFVFVRRLLNHGLRACITGFRTLMAVCVWLIWVPYCTVWIWRLYFWTGDYIAWKVYGPPEEGEDISTRPNISSPLLHFIGNLTSISSPYAVPATSNPSAPKFNLEFLINHQTDPEHEKLRRAWIERTAEKIVEDVFAGQIITTFIVVAFLATFLLREWIVQNAVPGVFGDDALGNANQAAQIEGQDGLPDAVVDAIAPPVAANPVDGGVGVPVIPPPPPQPIRPIDIPPVQRVPVPQFPPRLAALRQPGGGQRERDNQLIVEARRRFREEGVDRLRQDPAFIAEVRGALQRLNPAPAPRRAPVVVQPPRPIPHHPAPDLAHLHLNEPILQQPPVLPPLPHQPQLQRRNSMPGGFKVEPTGWSSSTQPTESNPDTPSSALFFNSASELNKAFGQVEGGSAPSSSRIPPVPLASSSIQSGPSNIPGGSQVEAGPSTVPPSTNTPGGSLISLSTRVRSSSIDREDSAAKVREWREKYFAKMQESQSSASSSSSAMKTPGPVFKVDKGKGKAKEEGNASDEEEKTAIEPSPPPASVLPSFADVAQRMQERGRELEQNTPVRSTTPNEENRMIGSSIQHHEVQMLGKGKRRRSTSPSPSAQRLLPNHPHSFKRKLSLDDESSVQNNEWPSSQDTSAQDNSLAQSLAPDSYRFSFTTPTASSSTYKPTPLMSTVQDYNSPNRIFRNLDKKANDATPTNQNVQPDVTAPSSSFSTFQMPPVPSSSRRPPLLPTTPISELPPPTPRPGHVAAVTPSALSNMASSSRPTPLPQSPGLVTYQPPEELEAAAAGYFDQQPPDRLANQRAGERDNAPLPDANNGLNPNVAQILEEARREVERRAAAAALDDPIRQIQIVPEPPEDDVGAAAGDDNAGLDVDFVDGADDDMDGAMEAIGIRGPVHAVVQNAAIMMMILDVAIFLGLWLPFTIGKTAALITLRPRQGLWLLNVPIRAVRLITDPFVDLLIFVVQRILVRLATIAWPLLGPPYKALIFPAVRDFITYTERYPTFHQWITGASNYASPGKPAARQRAFDVALITLREMFMPASSGTTTPKPDPSSSPSTSMLSRLLPLKHSRFDYVVDTLTENVPLAAKVVARVQYAVQSLQNSWVSLARGNETSHRVFAVALGYVVMSIFVLLYLGAAGANLGKLGRGLRKLVWQQWVIIKVAFFVLMEIIIFPLGCGLLVDFSLLPLFPDGQLESRIVFCNYSPMTCLFYHWTLGTSFMYQFAILLASCRSLMRKGAMWFIKDPGDPNFSPVREILERPVLTQLRKLTLSAIMYTAVIVGGVGGILFTVRSIKLQLFNPSLLPLNLSMREPLSQIPIDLLFIHIFLGPSLQYARPKRHLLNGLRVWWKHSAKFLRLTSYMYGTRQPAEEAYSEVGLVEQLLAKLRGTPITQKTVFQGGFLRVPNTDTGAFPTNKPALIRVDEEGHPITEAGAELMHIQDEATRKAGRDVDKDFMVVYVPPHLRYRVITFIVLFWLTGALTVILGLGVPIAVGRHIIQLCGMSPVHDGYTLIIGLYCVWGFVFVYRILFRIVKRRRYTTPQRLLLKLSAWLAASVYLVTMLGIVLPILLALVIDFYIILPIRLRLGTLDLPRIHVVESWAVGLLYAKIGIRLMRMEEANDISLALEAIMRDGLRRPQVWFATRYFILPVGGGMIGMICLPPAIMYAGQYFLPAWQQEQAAFRYGYPGVFFLACLAVLSRSLHMVIRRWFQAIRDTEYLLELRLTNLEKTANGDEPDDTQ